MKLFTSRANRDRHGSFGTLQEDWHGKYFCSEGDSASWFQEDLDLIQMQKSH